MALFGSELWLVLSEVDMNFRVENTPVYGVVHGETTQTFLLGSPLVGFVSVITNKSLSTTFPDVELAETAVRALVSEICRVPAFCVHTPLAEAPARFPLNPPAPDPPLTKTTDVAELLNVDVPASPDIVTEGVHAGSNGTLLCNPIVILFEAQGNGELCNTIVYRRAGIT